MKLCEVLKVLQPDTTFYISAGFEASNMNIIFCKEFKYNSVLEFSKKPEFDLLNDLHVSCIEGIHHDYNEPSILLTILELVKVEIPIVEEGE